MKLGWIGAGQMGYPMAGNLPAAGHEISVFDPKPDIVELLASRDAAKDAGVKLDIGTEIAGVFRDMLLSPETEKDFFATVLRTERAAGLGKI